MMTILITLWWFTIPRNSVGNIIRSFPAKKSLRFFVFGDSGTGGKKQFEVARAMERRCVEQHGIDGILMLGDNIYYSGVSSVEDPQWQQKIWEPYGTPCLQKSPIFPVLGNHDYRLNPGAQIEYTNVNKRWIMPHRFYVVDFGDLLRIIGFDSQRVDFCFSSICEIDFLLKSLKESSAVWKIAMAHHPLSSASLDKYSYRGNPLGFFLLPLICDEANVWLSGHSHHLEHRELSDCNTSLIISGGGGANLSEVIQNQTESKFVASKHGFLELEVFYDRLIFRFIDEKNIVLYEGEKLK